MTSLPLVGSTIGPALRDGTSPGKPPERVSSSSTVQGEISDGCGLESEAGEFVSSDKNGCVMIDMVPTNVVLENNRPSGSQIPVPQVMGLRTVDQMQVSFRDKVVGKSHGGAVVSEVPDLDVTIGDEDVQFGTKDAPVEEPPSCYGPWMQVTSRRNRRNVVRKEGERAGDGALSRVIADNRFDVLNMEDDNVVVQNDGAVKMSSIPSGPKVPRPTTGLSGNNGKKNWDASKIDKIRLGKAVVVTSGEAGDVRSATASAIKDDDSLEKDDRALEVASDGIVVSVPVTLNPSINVAVRVLNKTTVGERVVLMEENMAAYDELASMDQIKERRLTKVKGSARRTPYLSRRAATMRIENVGPTKVQIGEWVEGMTREL
ncbi:hypothetical protein V6N11_084320 [Hibiscus sabdariffa]|uniref:Uncharacterized protein n=1 Tax=Hibiscus sabdariffa TaxID=183260 RepID=A0ABR2QSQ7_9ROSI